MIVIGWLILPQKSQVTSNVNALADPGVGVRHSYTFFLKTLWFWLCKIIKTILGHSFEIQELELLAFWAVLYGHHLIFAVNIN